MPNLSDLPFGSPAPSPPAVRKPRFAIAFGAASAGGGDGLGGVLGGAVAAAGALGLALPGGGANDPWQRGTAAIEVVLGTAPVVDFAAIDAATGEGNPAAALGDEGTVGLGYEDAGEPQPVLAGRIDTIRRGIVGGTRYVATGGAAALARLRVAKSYEGQNAGEIAKDLAAEAGVTVGRIADGLDFPYLVLDGRRSAWDHLADLALRSGLFATVSADGKLDFGPPDTEPAATFTFAVDLLAFELKDGSPPFATLALTGEGAAGSQGQSAWGWLLKDPAAVQFEAGSGKPTRALSDATLRSSAAVRTAAANRLAAASRSAARGRLLVPGAPTIRPGQLVEVAAAPAPLAAQYLVTGVRHRFSKREGFTTRLDVVTAAAAGGGPLEGVLGALGGLL